VSVCLSVTSRCSIETALQIRLIFGTDASLGASYFVDKKSGIFKNKAFSSETSSQTL